MMQSLSAVTTADAENGKFYIVWLDSSVKNDYHYYIDEFDAAYEKLFPQRMHHHLSAKI